MLNEIQFLARQAIVSKHGSLFGHELLHREHGHDHHCKSGYGVGATAEVMVNALLNLGQREVSEGLPLFINVDNETLLLPVAEIITPRIGYIELLESVKAGPQVEARIADLRNRGYQFALDDVASMQDSRLRMLEHIDIIKIDIKAVSEFEMRGLLQIIKRAGKFALAEKVETQSELNYYKSLGFDLFQGFATGLPVHMVCPSLPACSPNTINRLVQLIRYGASNDAMAMAVMADPSLSLHLLIAAGLHTVNNDDAGPGNLTELLNELPRHLLQAWLIVLQKCRPQPSSGDWQVQASYQARFMQLAAQRIQPANGRLAGRAFMLGLVAYFKSTLRNVLTDNTRSIRVSADIRDAWLYRKGVLGALLDLATGSRINGLNWIPSQLDVKPAFKESIPAISLEAVRWARDRERLDRSSNRPPATPAHPTPHANPQADLLTAEALRRGQFSAHHKAPAMPAAPRVVRA